MNSKRNTVKTYKNCQSCGMSMRKDPKKGGTNADGSKNLMYCSYCFANGHFIHPYMTLEEMKIFMKNNLKEIGYPGFIARIFTKGIRKLERWRKRRI